MPIAYLIPEFPGQTHIWMWRERTHLIEQGLDVRLVSTRRPPDRDRARHDFAQQAQRDTFYLWPMPPGEIALSLLGLLTVRLPALLSMIALCRRLARDHGPPLRGTLPLVLPAARLARWARGQGVDHVHAATPAGSLITALLAKRLHPMTVDVVVNANFEWWGGALPTKFAEADAVIVITDWMLRHAREHFAPGIAGKVALARIGVDTQAWTPGPRRPIAAPLRIAAVGRLHPSKGHDDLIRALHLLHRRGRSASLTLMGEGPQRPQLEALIAELGLGPHVTLTGSVAEHTVREQLAAHDVFVGASHAEPLGVVYMEAMALGVPTIGTDAGGAPEIIEHGVSGLLVPPGDPAALADALERLIDEPGLAERLAVAGRERIVSAFDSRIGAADVAAVIARCRQPKSNTGLSGRSPSTQR
jgi:glycosyltransferase involved in cell wall biosynthesis